MTTKAEFHPKFTNFKLVGHVDVDSGSIWVGDPCYVFKDKVEDRPKDFGKNWGDICDTFYDRSGYNKRSTEWSHWASELDREVLVSEEVSSWYALHRNDLKSEKDWHGPLHQEYRDLIDKVGNRLKKERPFKPTTIDTGYANFNHDGGWGGMGTMMNTNYGDGTYPVYIEYDKNGRPSRMMVDFFGDPDVNYDEIDEEEYDAK